MKNKTIEPINSENPKHYEKKIPRYFKSKDIDGLKLKGWKKRYTSKYYS